MDRKAFCFPGRACSPGKLHIQLLQDEALDLVFEFIQKIALIRKMSENSSAIIIPGYLETSEETVTMETFKKNPKGLAYYEQRGGVQSTGSSVNV